LLANVPFWIIVPFAEFLAILSSPWID